jgi:exosortase
MQLPAPNPSDSPGDPISAIGGDVVAAAKFWAAEQRAALSASASRLMRAAGQLPLSTMALIVGLAALVLPTLLSLATNYWSTSSGAQGPIILVSAIWLLWRERDSIRLRPGSISRAWLIALIPPLLLLYTYARVFTVLTLESAALYSLLVLLAFFYWGPATMRREWFAVLYCGFLVRPPAGITAELTQPLKIWISSTAASLLYAAGYPIASAGVRIQVAQYELLVQQACAGLGSIFSLLAICLLYVQLVGRSDPIRNSLLLAGAIPVAVGANLLRVILLILITYYLGNGVAQGFAHEAAGISTFVLSLLGMAALDHALGFLPAGRRANA